MHLFPQLRKLERKYAGELAVVGVHSAKFEAEKATQNVRQAILRYGIEHPVANDREFAVWQSYGVRAWPTLMFVDPTGKVIGKHEGEIPFEDFDRVIGDMVREFDDAGLIDHRPLSFKLEREKEKDRPLSFPGKVLADARSGRLFIADSNHSRLVVASLEGEVLDVVGSGEAGLSDGDYSQARFDGPQGMALSGNTLYVADTENHAIREVDLANQNVKTIAGTGEQAMSFHDGGAGAETPLSSPWDLAVHDGGLYVAMAGFHQLWRLDLTTLDIRPHAGSGREGIVNGPHMSAELAQPCGIATDGGRLYFADSETSAIRTAALDGAGRVETIVGLDLFTFGDVDGVGDRVRLQHTQGIDALGGTLYIADTYNNKIKKISPDARESTTLLGSGRAGHRNGPGELAEFHEPGGLSIASGLLYVADTNNHVVRVADLDTGEVTTLELAWT
jgi:sugar lactone lactonase YvrE